MLVTKGFGGKGGLTREGKTRPTTLRLERGPGRKTGTKSKENGKDPCKGGKHYGGPTKAQEKTITSRSDIRIAGVIVKREN